MAPYVACRMLLTSNISEHTYSENETTKLASPSVQISKLWLFVKC